jgi:UDP-glucose 4-epimerase
MIDWALAGARPLWHEGRAKTGARMSENGGNLIVTGASGRVGRLLAAQWAAQGAALGARVCLQVRGAAVRDDLPSLRWSPLEDGPAALARQLRALGGARTMLVLAGVTPTTTGGDMDLNAPLSEACLAAAAEAGIGRVLLASSSAVYGGGRAVPWREDEAPATPPSAYGAAKRAMEAAGDGWRARGLSVCSLRIGNVAGADALLINAAKTEPHFIDRFASGGGPVRSYIGPASLARVIEALAAAPELPPVLNVAAPAPVAMVDLARAAGGDWRWRPAPEGAVERLTLDCSALGRYVHFAPAESTATELVAQWRACREDA